jgi:hypothetical protein
MRQRHLTGAEMLVLVRTDRRLAAGRARHAIDCPRCRAEVDALRDLAAYLRHPAPAPPAGTVARAWALVEPRAPRRSEMRRFRLALLMFDNQRLPVAAGARGTPMARNQMWRTEAADVDVRLDAGGLGAAPRLVGQLLPRGRGRLPVGQGTVWLLEPRRPPRWAALGASGEFSLPAPSQRRWSLCVEWGSLRLRLEAP